MPDDKGRLFVSDIAARLGISESDWRARVARGHAPSPDGRVLWEGHVRAVWKPETIDDYERGRADRLAARKGAGD